MSEQPGNGYTRAKVALSTGSPRPGNGFEVTFPTVAGSWDIFTSYSVRPPETSWGTFTFAVIYDNAPPRTALDFVRASNRWPKPYSTALWAGALP